MEQRVLVTGAKGQLGSDIVARLERENISCKGIGREEVDLTNREAVFAYVKGYSPTLIIHCAAYVAVDKAEEERELCYDTNVNGTKYLVDAAKEISAEFLYFSTDYIFNRPDTTPLEVEEEKNPINYYGYTKNLGEEYVTTELEKHYVGRISWVFGKSGKNFVSTMIELGKTRDELTVVSDQVGSPTFTEDVANWVVEVMEKKAYGIYHVTNEGFCSWYQFAKKIFELGKIDITVKPVSSEEFKTAARRPKNSRMSKKSSIEKGINLLPPWEDAVKRYLNK